MAVLFDSAGVGSVDAAGFLETELTTSWNHNSSGDKRAVLVGVVWVDGGSVSATRVRSVKYGGVDMTLLGTVGYNNDLAGNCIEAWGLLNQPTGDKTIATSHASFTNSNSALACTSVSYTGVESFDAVIKRFGPAGSEIAFDVAGPVNTRIPVIIGSESNVSQFNRQLRGARSAYNARCLMGDAQGEQAPLQFAAAHAPAKWGAITVPMIPAAISNDMSSSIAISTTPIVGRRSARDSVSHRSVIRIPRER